MSELTQKQLKNLDVWIANWMGYGINHFDKDEMILYKPAKEVFYKGKHFTQSLDSCKLFEKKLKEIDKKIKNHNKHVLLREEIIEEKDAKYALYLIKLTTFKLDWMPTPLGTMVGLDYEDVYAVATATPIQRCLALYKTITGNDYE